MRIGLLVGPCPKGKCGVGDYVYLLAEALRFRGMDVTVIDFGDWSAFNVFGLNRMIRNCGFDVAQIHYPSVGFGTDFGPQAISLLNRCVVTMHETSQVHVLRRLAMVPFALRCLHVVFFSSVEREYGIRWAPWLARKSSIIPPPSNIRKFAYDGPRVLDEIVSFGMIRPGNAHDRVLELASLIKNSGLHIKVRVIGSVQSDKFIPYFNRLRRESEHLPVIWDHGLSEVQVAERLAKSSIAYLPYPDGAAELRSSLKAALLNGLAIITTQGKHTPPNLNGVVEFSKTPQDAFVILQRLVASPTERLHLGQRACEYVKDWTWARSAELYDEVYQKILSDTLEYRALPDSQMTE